MGSRSSSGFRWRADPGGVAPGELPELSLPGGAGPSAPVGRVSPYRWVFGQLPISNLTPARTCLKDVRKIPRGLEIFQFTVTSPSQVDHRCFRARGRPRRSKIRRDTELHQLVLLEHAALVTVSTAPTSAPRLLNRKVSAPNPRCSSSMTLPILSLARYRGGMVHCDRLHGPGGAADAPSSEFSPVLLGLRTPLQSRECRTSSMGSSECVRRILKRVLR